MSYARALQPHGDMASCATTRCNRTADCWRFQKPPVEFRQTYSDFGGVGECLYFIPILKHRT